MNTLLKNVTKQIGVGVLAVVLGLSAAGVASAHCDTLEGPVVQDAKLAFEKGSVDPTLKWVGKADEAAVKAAFKQALAVRALGAEAQALAERYFFETLVRLHRAGEGAPYTGLKDEPVEPVVALAEKALADGSSDALSAELSAELSKGLQAKLADVTKAQKKKDKNVKSGRKYVEAYVAYMHYVEGLHNAIRAGGHHAEAGGAKHPEHKK